MQRYANWSIAAAVSWVFFFVVLFTGIIKKTSVFREYGCSVTGFSVDPRFECTTRCSVTDSQEPMVPHMTSYITEEDVLAFDYLSSDDAMELAAMLERDEINISEEQFIDLLQTVEQLKNNGNHRNPGRGDDDGHEKYPDCDVLEKDTLDWYNPTLCLHAPGGFENPLCPPENAPCYTGKKWRRKCGLSCPLAYNVTLSLDVDHIGGVSKNRDLGTNRDRYLSYKDEYTLGKRLSCQVVKDISGNNDVLFLDERMSHTALQWWKWGMFSLSIFLVLLTSMGAVVSYMRFREAQPRGVYAPIAPDGDE